MHYLNNDVVFVYVLGLTAPMGYTNCTEVIPIILSARAIAFGGCTKSIFMCVQCTRSNL